MKDGVCTKGFPKQFAQETTLSPKGFPNYKRREGDKFVKRTRPWIIDGSFF
jgi:hypothetical protein